MELFRLLIFASVILLPVAAAIAADASQINGLAADWAAMARLNEHVAQGLQALAKQYQETDAALTAEREYWKRYVEGLGAPKAGDGTVNLSPPGVTPK